LGRPSGYGNRETGYCGSVGPHRSGRGSAIAAPQEAAAKNNGGGRYSGRERGRERESRGATAEKKIKKKKNKRLTIDVGHLGLVK
jgi:hypothetical protein